MAKSWSALVSKQRGRGRVTVRGVVKRTQRSWLAIVQPRTRVAPSVRSLPILSVFRLMLDEREAREGCRVERFHEFPSFSSPRETTGIERREGERDGKKESQWRNRSWTKLLSSR